MNSRRTLCRQPDVNRASLDALFVGAAMILALFVSAVRLPAQSPTTMEQLGGTTHLISFPRTVATAYDENYPPELLDSDVYQVFVYSEVDQDIDLGSPGSGHSVVRLQGGSFRALNTGSYIFDYGAILESNVIQRSVLEIRSEFPIVVYGFIGTAFGCGAYHALPVERWGQEYFVGAWPDETVTDVEVDDEHNLLKASPVDAPGQVLIIAAYNNTQVRIERGGSSSDCATCPTLTMNQGEVYLYEPPPGTDPAGLRITANKRFGVVSGNSRAMLRDAGGSLTNNSFKDLTMEFLTPSDLNGEEFVFTPTWDEFRLQDGVNSNEARQAERIRLFATDGEGSEVLEIEPGGSEASLSNGVLDRGEFVERLAESPRPYAFRIPKGGQAFSAPEAAVRSEGEQDGVTGFSGVSTFMVELTPRNRWSTFAPFRTPSWQEGQMRHWLNVVTEAKHSGDIMLRREGESARTVEFIGEVPGTDLVFGVVSLEPGQGYTLTGNNGATFTGHVYGLRVGFERFTTVPTRYEERVGIAYGYPLAPDLTLQVEPDTYKVDVEHHCDTTLVHILAVNEDPSGIRSITLLPDSSENALLEFIDPDDALRFKYERVSEATFRIVPIDPNRNHHGVVIIRDRSSESLRWRIETEYESHSAQYSPELSPDSTIVFEDVTVLHEGEGLVTIINPLSRDLVVEDLFLYAGNRSYTILRTEPPFDAATQNDPIRLASGDSLKIWIGIEQLRYPGEFVDYLRVRYECGGEESLKLSTTAVVPCLAVSNVDFDTVYVGQTATGQFELCNNGQGRLTFRAPYVVWLESMFSLSVEAFNILESADLGPGECLTIPVSFTPEAPGTYEAVARFLPLVSDCVDTATWRAVAVRESSSVSDGGTRIEISAGVAVHPNPSDGSIRVRFATARASEIDVAIYTAEGKRVATLAQGMLESGAHSFEWNGAEFPNGTYFVRVTTSGGAEQISQFVLRR